MGNLQHNEGLFAPWDMKLSEGYVNFVVGCWTRPRSTSAYTKEKNCQGDHEVQGPQRHILRPTFSIDMV